MSGKDKAMYSPPGSLHALVPSGSVDKNSSKQDWLSREVVVEISAETDGDAGHRGPGPTAQEVESGVRLSLDSSDMAGGGGDDDDDSRAAGTPSGVQVKWKSWHDRVQETQQSSRLVLVFLTAIGLVFFMPLLLVFLVLLWFLGVLLDKTPLPTLATGVSLICLLIYGLQSVGRLEDFVGEQAHYRFTEATVDILIFALVFPPFIAASAGANGRVENAGFENNKVLYDSVQYSSKGLGADEFGLWGVWIRPRIFFVILLNAILILAKWIGFWTSSYWLDPQHEWHLPLLLLSAYTLGLVAVCISCVRLWRLCSVQQLLAAEIRLIKSVPGTSRFRILNCERLHTIDFMDVSHVTTHRGDNFCDKEIMVLLPGFGSVAAFFVKAVPKLSSQYHIICVDWLGTGGSDRPDYTCTPGEEAEAFFVDALEKWRIGMGYDRIHICGHSIGAILATSYAIRHPSHVISCCLASPVMPRDFVPVVQKERTSELPIALRIINYAAWKKQITPQTFLRLMGPLGPWMVRRSVRRRFTRYGQTAPVDLELMSAILWHNFGLKKSGEMMLSGVLRAGAQPRIPFKERMVKGPDVLWCFIFGGDTDWMDSSKGDDVVAALQAAGKRATSFRVMNAGHQLFLDDPDGTARAMIKCIKHLERNKP